MLLSFGLSLVKEKFADSCPFIPMLKWQAKEYVEQLAIFWHALTGCDAISQFLGCGKPTAWKTLEAFPEATVPLLSYPN